MGEKQGSNNSVHEWVKVFYILDCSWYVDLDGCAKKASK
jgi:hypothetical protein